jgi:alanyl-tRNA synthetase
MKTVKLYQSDVNKREGVFQLREMVETETRCKELGVKYIPDTLLLALDETIFYPQGGGQPCDLGEIEGFGVIEVFEDPSVETVYHRLPARAAEKLINQTHVRCSLDWQRRFSHMQMHCAEHLLSGLIWKLFQGINKGFHMGEDYFTIDILFEKGGEYTDFTENMLDEAELSANKAIWADVPVVTRYCSSREEAEANPLRKPLALDEDITIVTIASAGRTYDCCACCGTHVDSTGQIGLLKIIKAENYKGMTRLTVKAGLPAYTDVLIRHKVTTLLCNRHSTEISHLLERIDVQDSKNGAARKELYDLKKNLLEEEKISLTACFNQRRESIKAGETLPSICVRYYDRYSVEDLQTLGRSLGADLPCLAALVSEKESTAVLVSSGSPSCGALVKEYASLYQGKGGGSDQLARAIFQKKESVDTFLDLLEKHLR